MVQIAKSPEVVRSCIWAGSGGDKGQVRIIINTYSRSQRIAAGIPVTYYIIYLSTGRDRIRIIGQVDLEFRRFRDKHEAAFGCL